MKLIDPVCEMAVDSHSRKTTYQDMEFFFCSLQCKQRFLANPHLYIGYPGHKAPKQTGEKIIKHRRIHLNQPLTNKDITFVYAALLSLMGIEHITVTGTTIEISYDLLQVSLQQIEEELIANGYGLNKKWADRIRRNILHETEEMQIDSMEVMPHKHRH